MLGNWGLHRGGEGAGRSKELMLGLGSGSHLLHLCSLELSLTGVQLALASCDLYPEGLAGWPHPGAATCQQTPGPASLSLSFPGWLWPWSPLMIPYRRLITADTPNDKGSLQSFCLFSQHPSFTFFAFNSPRSSLSISFSLLPVFSTVYSVFPCCSHFVSLLYIRFFLSLSVPHSLLFLALHPSFLLSPLSPIL